MKKLVFRCAEATINDQLWSFELFVLRYQVQLSQSNRWWILRTYNTINQSIVQPPKGASKTLSLRHIGNIPKSNFTFLMWIRIPAPKNADPDKKKTSFFPPGAGCGRSTGSGSRSAGTWASPSAPDWAAGRRSGAPHRSSTSAWLLCTPNIHIFNHSSADVRDNAKKEHMLATRSYC